MKEKYSTPKMDIEFLDDEIITVTVSGDAGYDENDDDGEDDF